MKYVVYQLRLSDEEHPFYIGMGSKSRPNEHLSGKDGNNRHKNNKIKKAKSDGVQIIVDVLREGLSLEEACELETHLISKWGRRDIGTGCLTNMTSGGEGLKSPSEETRQKIRDARLNQTNNPTKASNIACKGVPLSEEHKNKLRNAKLGTVRSEIAKLKTSESLQKYHTNNKYQLLTCPHCGLTGKESGMKSWHFDYCKLNPNRKQRRILCAQ